MPQCTGDHVSWVVVACKRVLKTFEGSGGVCAGVHVYVLAYLGRLKEMDFFSLGYGVG